MKKILIILIICCTTILFAEKKFEKGFYLTAYKLNMNKTDSLLQKAKESDFTNAVFDLKNMNGEVFTSVPENLKEQYDLNPFLNIQQTVNRIHRFDLKATARVVMFHNIYAAKKFPELRPYNKKLKKPWKELNHKEPSWLDSSNPRVQQNLLDFIEHIASQGLDEIQMDYIRFPTQGDHKNIQFHFNKINSSKKAIDSTYVEKDRTDIIAEFVRKAKKICEKHNVRLTADVFAIAVWQRSVDVKKTGQDLPEMTKHLDAIHPMVYSSHFANNFGFREDVHNEPYNIVLKCSAKAKEFTDKNCDIIPYIQANAYRVNYKKEYIYAQDFAVKNSGSEGYILWDARCRYDKIFKWLNKLKTNQE